VHRRHRARDHRVQRGGRVVVPASGTARTFLTGAIRLRGNVNLHVAAGATLKFSTNPNHYLPAVRTSFEGSDCYNYCPLIYAPWRTNVAVTGTGTLDGQASNQHWWPWFGDERWGWSGGPKQNPDRAQLAEQNKSGVLVGQRVYGAGHYLRPSFIQPYRCTNVLIEGVTLRNGPFWLLHPLFSRSVTIRNVTVQSLGPNSDGCDIECCSDVLVQGCRFDTEDDCMVVKSGRYRDGVVRASPSHHIVLRGNRVSRGNGALAIGSEQGGGAHHIYLEDLTGDDPNLSIGLLLKATRRWSAGLVEQVYARRIDLAGVRNEAVMVTYKIYNMTDGPYRPVFRDIDISGMTCGRSKNALKLIGFPDEKIEDVRVSDSAFSNVSGTGVVRADVTGLQLTNVRVNGRLV
jgi:polygalacturonase